MAVPNREQLVNDGSSTLNGGIDNSQTTLDVVDGSSFPSTGNFRVIIEDEILLCTARSTNTLTVVRGVEGTAAASHSDGLAVSANLTAGGLLQWAQDNQEGWGNPSAPPLATISDGSGGILDSSDFTWVNQGSSAVSDQNGTIYLRAPASTGENCRILKMSAPSAPFTVVAAFQTFKIREGLENFGVVFRESSTGKFTAFANAIDSSGTIRFAVLNFTDHDTLASTPYARNDSLHTGEYLWIKVQDNSTNLIFSISYDGVEWTQLFSVSRTAHMAGGPDEIGFYANNQGSTTFDMGVRLSHWSTF
jgi:hypothetical protein